MSTAFRIGVVSSSAALAQRFAACMVEAAIREAAALEDMGHLEVAPDSALRTRQDRLSMIFRRSGMPETHLTPKKAEAPKRGFSTESLEESGPSTAKTESDPREPDIAGMTVILTPPGAQPVRAVSGPSLMQRMRAWLFPDFRPANGKQGATATSVRRLEFECLGLGANEEDMRAEFQRLCQKDDLQAMILYHRLLAEPAPGAESNTVAALAEWWAKHLPEDLQKTRPVRLIVVLDDALLPASFLSKPTSEAELRTMLEAAGDAAEGARRPDAGLRFTSPYDHVDTEAYRRHILARYGEDPDLHHALTTLSHMFGAPAGQDLPATTLVLVDSFGRDKTRQEIAAICWIADGIAKGEGDGRRGFEARYDSTLGADFDGRRSALGLAPLTRRPVAYADPMSRWVPFGYADVWQALEPQAGGA